MKRLTSLSMVALVGFGSLCSAQESFFCETSDQQVVSRVVGGQDAMIQEYPWQVSLVHPEVKGATGHFCGGSLISENWVLTAAHCVEGELGNPDKLQVFIGEAFPAAGTMMRVSNVISHPEYLGNILEHDIALIRLEQKESDPIARAVLLSSTDTDAVFARPGLCSHVSGYGALQADGAVAARLQAVSVPITTPQECTTAYPDVDARHVCAGYVGGGKDSCQGDSGGPLTVQIGDTNQHVQVGVVSYGRGCAEPGFPGVYTRVSAYIDWIQSHTGK